MASQPVFFPDLFAELYISVFGISCDRVPGGGEVASDLVRLARDQFHFHEREMISGKERPVYRLCEGASLIGLPVFGLTGFCECDSIGSTVFFKISIDPAPFVHLSDNYGLIEFAKGSVAQKLSHYSCSLKGDGAQLDPSGISVKPVAHGRAELPDGFRADLSFFEQIADKPLVH